MKNFKTYITSLMLGGAAILTLGSCADELDITPDGRLTLDEVFADVDYTESFFSSAFDDVPRKHVNYYWFENMPSAISDEAWSCDDVEGVGAINAYKGQGNSERNLWETNFNPDAAFDCEYWNRYWRSIRKLNVFLDRLPTAAVRSEAYRERMGSEALILRAFYYLQLVKHYGDIPLIHDVPDLDSDFKDYPRRPAYEILQQCVTDCEKALESPNVPWRIYNLSERNRFTLGTACAIISQASLYAASKLYCKGNDLRKYAYEKNKFAYETLKAQDFELYTELHDEHYNSAYQELFAGGAPEYPGNKETIMGSINLNQPNYWVWGLPIQNNYRAGDVPTQELVDSYDMLATGLPVLDRENPYLDEFHLEPNYYPESGYRPTNPFAGRDLRFDATVLHNGSTIYVGDVRSTVQTFAGGNCEIKDNARTYTRTGYYNNKYRNWYNCASKRTQDGFWIYFRMGEVYLNYAEAAMEYGDLTTAMSLVNTIRHRAGFSPEVDLKCTDQNECRLIVRKERRTEFPFEEHRYYDCRRWTANDEDILCEKYATGMRVTRRGIAYSYERFLVGSDGTAPSKLSYQAKWHFLPIPLAEARTMEEKQGVKWQNYGW